MLLPRDTGLGACPVGLGGGIGFSFVFSSEAIPLRDEAFSSISLSDQPPPFCSRCPSPLLAALEVPGPKSSPATAPAVPSSDPDGDETAETAPEVEP